MNFESFLQKNAELAHEKARLETAIKMEENIIKYRTINASDKIINDIKAKMIDASKKGYYRVAINYDDLVSKEDKTKNLDHNIRSIICADLCSNIKNKLDVKCECNNYYVLPSDVLPSWTK